MIHHLEYPIYIMNSYRYLGNNQFEVTFSGYKDPPGNFNLTTDTIIVPSSVIFYKVFSYFSAINLDMSKFPDLATFLVLGNEKYKFMFKSNPMLDLVVQFSDKQHVNYTISLNTTNSTMSLSVGDDIRNLEIDKNVLFSFLDD